MDRILIETAFEVLVKARALEAKGRSVIHLEIGEPDFATPEHIVEAGKKALDEGWTHYGPTAGYPDFREVLARHVSETRGIPVDPANVCVVPGGKPIIFFPILALIEEGDEVIYPNPGFPIYESMIQFAGGIPVPMPLVESRSFSFDLDLLRSKITGKTKLLILNSPQNPTGGVIPPEDIAAIAEMVRDRDMMVLSDEIYSRIAYGEKPPLSIASCPGMAEKTIILDGFSKIYAMTGWRMGYGVMPNWLAEAVNKLMVNSNSCTASFTQRAGIAAITGPQNEPESMVARPGRRVLCIPLHSGHWVHIAGTRRQTPAGGRRRLPQRHIIRRVRRRLSTVQLCKLA
jgi:aspartate aminotransferase